jgi:hypothetical protein
VGNGGQAAGNGGQAATSRLPRNVPSARDGGQAAGNGGQAATLWGLAENPRALPSPCPLR